MPCGILEACARRKRNAGYILKKLEIAFRGYASLRDESIELFHLAHAECRLHIREAVVVPQNLHFLMPCRVFFILELFRIARKPVRAEHDEPLVVSAVIR